MPGKKYFGTHVHMDVDCVLENSLSQNGEDIMLLPSLLHAAKGHSGSFVEIGANDGVYLSNTFVLERCFNWTGLLIEANPANFKKLERNTQGPHGRHRSKAIHSAVCERAGTVRVTVGGGVTAGVVEDMSETFKQRYLKRNKGNRTVAVPCNRMDELMSQAGFLHTTFLSLDAEGAEATILSTVNPANFDVILVELDGSNPAKDAYAHKLITTAGLKEITKQLVPRNSRVYVSDKY